METKKRKIIKCLAFLFVIGIFSCGMFLWQAEEVQADVSLKAIRKDVYSDTVTLRVEIKNLDIEEVYIDTASCGKDTLDTWQLENLKHIKGTNRYEKTFKLKKTQYGKYSVTVIVAHGVYDDYEGYQTYEIKKSVSFEYRSKGMGIGNKSGDYLKYGNITYNNGQFKKVTKGGSSVGNEVFLKPGESIQADVLYNAGFAGSVVGYTKLSWGGKMVSGSSAGRKQGGDGLYYTSMKYNISSATDYEGSLTASYSYQGISGSKSLGVTVKVDGTKPKIKIAQEYSGGGTKYVNKVTSIPVTIEEKNFDQGKTTVLINGKSTSVSWSGSGSTHTAKVPLREGKNVIEVYSTDKAGNKSDTVKSAEIILDKKAPKVNIIGFANGAGKGLKNGEVVKYPLKVVITDETKLGNVSVNLYRVNDSGKGKTKINLSREGSGKRIVYSISDLAEDGYYTLSVTAKDRAQNNVTKGNIKSEGKKKYVLSGGKVKGSFTVNRKGSLYSLENEDIFAKPINSLEEIVIYEYNKNKITKNTVTIISSKAAQPKILKNNEYRFEEVKSEKAEYRHKYKYTIYRDNFDEGRYNIEIHSESIAGTNGSAIAQIVESNSLNKTIRIDKTRPEIISFMATEDGEVRVKIRDRYLDKNSVYVQIGNKKTKLTMDKDDSTSSNVVFTGNVKGNLRKATILCKDTAGNTQPENSREVEIESNSPVGTILMYVGLVFGAIVLIVGTVITMLMIRKKD